MEEYSYEYIYIIIKSLLLSYFSFSYYSVNVNTNKQFIYNNDVQEHFFSYNIHSLVEKKINFYSINKKFISNVLNITNKFFINSTNKVSQTHFQIFNKYIKNFSFSMKNFFLIKPSFFFFMKNVDFYNCIMFLNFINSLFKSIGLNSTITFNNVNN